VIASYATPKVEIRILGTGALLSTLAPTAVHAYDATPFDSWMINTTGQDHHGDMFAADGGVAACQGCHWYGAMKQYAFSVIRVTDGYCYSCHYGTDGPSAGFVDPAR
jgi:hypothetical protein